MAFKKAKPGRGLFGSGNLFAKSKKLFSLRLVLMGLPILLAMIYAIYQFNTDLSALLLSQQERIMSSVAVRYVQAVQSRLQADQAVLNFAADRVQSQGMKNQDEFLDVVSRETKVPDFLIAPVYKDSISFKDGNIELSNPIGNDAALTLSRPISSFSDLIATSLYSVYWVKGQSQILWATGDQTRINAMTMDLENVAIPAAGTDVVVNHTHDAILVRCMLSISDWSVVFNFPIALVKQARLPVVQSSITFAILFALIILSLLFYFMWRDKQYEHSLLRLAYIDDLTKLPNKNSFIKDAYALIQQTKTPYALMVIDITKFKLINDHFGYTFGDTLLIHFASVLPRYTTIDGLCARLDADRFLLLIAYRDKRALEERIKQLSKELGTFSFPASSRFHLNVAIGIFVVEGKRISIPIAIDRALIALSDLKAQHKSGFQYYEEAIRDQLVEENELDQVFKAALKNHEFFVVLQPKYSLENEKLCGAEALVRWNHPTKGLLPPQKFIPLLEKYNLLTQLDMFVLEQVCKLYHSWKERGLPLLTISVNQSRSHFFNSHYEQTLVNLVDKYGIDHHLLEFELTESLFFEDIEHLSEVLGTLRREGFEVSLDDFGTGYSSLNMLKNVQIDKIKLDQGFFGDASDDKRSKNLVRSILNMAKDLGISTVAEGVERREQVEMLKMLGCDVAQGYYFSGPISLEEFERLLLTKDVAYQGESGT